MTKLFDDFMSGIEEIKKHEVGKIKLGVDKMKVVTIMDELKPCPLCGWCDGKHKPTTVDNKTEPLNCSDCSCTEPMQEGKRGMTDGKIRCEKVELVEIVIDKETEE